MDGWPQLTHTKVECQNLADDLSTLFGFQTKVLAEQNKEQIKDNLAELATRTYNPKDQLLLCFSMHGCFDEEGEAGCLCPAGPP